MWGWLESRNHTHVAMPFSASNTATGVTSFVISDVPSRLRMTTTSMIAPTSGAKTNTVTARAMGVGHPHPPSLECTCQ